MRKHFVASHVPPARPRSSETLSVTALQQSYRSTDCSHYLPTLDGWRAIAIAIVLFCHATLAFGTKKFETVGLLGVHIFFGLSGLLITTLLLREEAKSGSISLTGFYRRRAFRIIPAAAVYLLVVALLGLLGVIHITASRWASALLFLGNYSQATPSEYVAHFWSLAVEEHFYFLWPSVLVFVRRIRQRLKLAVAITALLTIWRLIDFKYRITWTDGGWFVGRTDIQADALTLGVIYALALADTDIGPKLVRVLQRPIILPLTIAVLVLPYALPFHVGWKTSFALVSFSAIAIPAMILATMLHAEGVVARALESRPMRFIGLISYSLYLWNQMFLVWSEHAPLLAPVQRFPVSLAAAFLCAVLSFCLVETPVREFGARLQLPARRIDRERARIIGAARWIEGAQR